MAKKLSRGYLLSLIGVAFFSAAWYVLHHDIVYHVDIARDLLLVEQMVAKHKLDLIGQRSSLPGLFHGPLWLYLQIPAFIIGGGNPLVIGWFWWLLVGLSTAVYYQLLRRFVSAQMSLVGAVIFAIIMAPQAKQLYNPFGAVVLAPVFFLFYLQYIWERKWRYLLATVLILGLIIQFQSAWGAPMLLLTFIHLSYVSGKKSLGLMIKTWACFLILLLPLATYIVFDLRHDFLQSRALINLFFGESKIKIDFGGALVERSKDMLGAGWGLFSFASRSWQLWFGTLFSGWLGWWLIRGKRRVKQVVGIFLYLYISYWMMMVFYKGVVWGFYFWPFLPLALLVSLYIHQQISHDSAPSYRRVSAAWLSLVLAVGLFHGIDSITGSNVYICKDLSSWCFNRKVAESVYRDAGGEFGYYIYSPEEYGYVPRFAMNFIGRQASSPKSYPYQKKATTYLLISPDLSDNPYTDVDIWRAKRVKIKSKPLWQFKYANQFIVEKYSLSEEEQAVESDPYMVTDTFFR